MTDETTIEQPAVGAVQSEPAQDVNKLAQLYSALAAAQGEFAKPVKTAKANYGRYATLTGCIEAVVPSLCKHGLFLSQPIEFLDKNTLKISTCIFHSSGVKVCLSEMIVTVDYSNRMNPNQARGSAITYGRRYGLCSALGLAAIDDDDDGNASGQGSAAENYQKRQTAPKPSPMSDEEQKTFAAFKQAFADAATVATLSDIAQKVKDLPKNVRDALVPFYRDAKKKIEEADAQAAQE